MATNTREFDGAVLTRPNMKHLLREIVDWLHSPAWTYVGVEVTPDNNLAFTFFGATGKRVALLTPRELNRHVANCLIKEVKRHEKP